MDDYKILYNTDIICPICKDGKVNILITKGLRPSIWWSGCEHHYFGCECPNCGAAKLTLFPDYWKDKDKAIPSDEEVDRWISWMYRK